VLFEVLSIEAVERLGSENTAQVLVPAFVFDEKVESVMSVMVEHNMCADYWLYAIFFGVSNEFRKTKESVIDNTAALYPMCNEVLKKGCEVRTAGSVITVIEKRYV
jgi:hypothetical protein